MDEAETEIEREADGRGVFVRSGTGGGLVAERVRSGSLVFVWVVNVNVFLVSAIVYKLDLVVAYGNLVRGVEQYVYSVGLGILFL